MRAPATLTIRRPSLYQRLQALGFAKKKEGLVFQTWAAANESMVAHRIFSIKMVQAKAFEAKENWEVAQKTYQSLVSINEPENPWKFTNEQKSTLLSRLAHCAMKLCDTDKSVELYAQSLSINRQAPGIHREIASAFQSRGEVERAKVTMGLAFAHEAPWDGPNTVENTEMYLKLCDEIMALEERRNAEKAFAEVWGEVLTLVGNKCTDLDGAISWASLKNKDFDMVAADSDGDSDDESQTDNGLDEVDTALKLEAAQKAALFTEGDVSETRLLDGFIEPSLQATPTMLTSSLPVGIDNDGVDDKQYDCIKLTKEALKNVKNLDAEIPRVFYSPS